MLEAVLAVSIIGLVIGGAVMLITASLKNRRVVFERQKGNELALKLMEERVALSQTDPLSFWSCSNVSTQNGGAGFEGYNYQIDCSRQTILDGCKDNISCQTIAITVGWSGAGSQADNQVIINRFFSR